MKDSFEKILVGAKRKPNFIETERGKEFYNNMFQDFLNNNNNKHYSRNTSPGAVFAERFNRTIRDLLKKVVFERLNANWIDVLSTITKQYSIKTQSSAMLAPIQASFKKNEGFVHRNLLDKRKKVKSTFQVSDVVRAVDLKRTFSKSDTKFWSYKLYKTTKIINDKIPRYCIHSIKERYNESLLKRTELTLKEKKDVMESLNLN